MAQAPEDTTSHAGEENPSPPRYSQLHEIARDHFEDTLDKDTPSEKNYHIREGLQALVIGIGIFPD